MLGATGIIEIGLVDNVQASAQTTATAAVMDQ